MLHVLPGSTAPPDVGSASYAVGSTQRSPTRVLITEQEVVFSTAAAISVPPATTRRRWLLVATRAAAVATSASRRHLLTVRRYRQAVPCRYRGGLRRR
jgi:hypothetical protein